jgi:hypothetical protein
MLKMEESAREKMVKIFGRFMFAEVPLVEETKTYKIGGKEHTYNNIGLQDENHPVLVDLRKTAKECGMTVRVWWPGMIATMELDRDRLNVHIEKSADGKWRIAERMNLDASPNIIRTMDEVIARGLDQALQVRKPFQLRKAPAP